MSEKQTLTARFEADAKDVALELALPGVGTQTQRVPLSVFMTSLTEWSKGEELASASADTSRAAILAALERPEKWQVSALATPLRYALCIEGDWRLAVAVRPAHTSMTLKYVPYGGDVVEDARSLAFLVPPRVIAGVWLKNQLRAGIIALASQPGDLPIAPNDTLHAVTPWVWGNVNHEGQVCFGSTVRPTWGQDGINNIERTFFESAFNSDICRFPRTPDPEDEDDDNHYHNLLTYHEAMAETDGEEVALPALSSLGSPRLLSAMLAYSIRTGW
jgi:hypothetical protein